MLTRRQFFPAISSRRENSDTLRIGLIGCGGRGSGAAEQALNADQERCAPPRWAMRFPRKNPIEPLPSCKGPSGSTSKSRRRNASPASTRIRRSSTAAWTWCCWLRHQGFGPVHLRAAVDAGQTHLSAKSPWPPTRPACAPVIESVKLAKEKKISLVAGFLLALRERRAGNFTKRIHRRRDWRHPRHLRHLLHGPGQADAARRVHGPRTWATSNGRCETGITSSGSRAIGSGRAGRVTA